MARKFTFDVEFDAPVTEVWRIVSDTNMLDAASGMPVITYRDEPQPDGTSRRFGSYRKSGVSFEYEELPFTWIHEQRFEVKRLYHKGAFKDFRHECEVIPRDPANPDAGCTVRTTFEFTPSGLFGVFAASGTRNSGVVPYIRLFKEASENLKRKSVREKRHSVVLRPPVMVGAPPKPGDVNTQMLVEAAARTRTILDTPALDRLTKVLSEASAEELRRMQPYAFARRWSADRQQVLNQFLAATRAGMLNMRWDVICPHCRGDKMNLATLGEVRERAFCPSCNIDFDVDLDRSLEAVFTPHPQVRDVPKALYCLGGPGTTPHVVYQHYLSPGAEHSFSINLAEGRYRVRVTGTETYRWIELTNDGPASSPEFTITNDGITGDDAEGAAGRPLRVKFKNTSGRNVLVAMETVEWARDALSAGQLVAAQQFRDLFSSEVLAPGIKLSIEDSTILFTDVVGSTAMYNTLGDARAFSLVRTHFDVMHEIVARNQGAIVKTIGDAIMAVFTRPDHALQAAADFHAVVDPYVREHGHESGVQLKIGLHVGPCIAVTLNERLDYFGTTVNLAARVQGMSEGGDIMTTTTLAGRTSDCEALRATGWRSSPEQAYAKGFDSPVPVLRWKRQGATQASPQVASSGN